VLRCGPFRGNPYDGAGYPGSSARWTSLVKDGMALPHGIGTMRALRCRWTETKMVQNASNDDGALADWEGEGGATGSPVSRQPKGHGHGPCRPSLPPGYETQQAWGFHDPTGEVSYEFMRVYRPILDRDQRGPFAHLDEGLSYWAAIWPTLGETGDERPTGRWMNYAQARTVWGARLTFARFSSVGAMQVELPTLLSMTQDVRDHSPMALR
jgi:hypothetical protein